MLKQILKTQNELFLSVERKVVKFREWISEWILNSIEINLVFYFQFFFFVKTLWTVKKIVKIRNTKLEIRGQIGLASYLLLDYSILSVFQWVNGRYLMSKFSNDGHKLNHQILSPCTKRLVTSNLEAPHRVSCLKVDRT